MLLRLIPSASDPTILFTLSFPSLPPPLPFPPAWASSLSLALAHNLPPPPSPHALDRACASVELTEVVLFDVPNESVHCRTRDGAEFEFQMCPELAAALALVVRDVQRSSIEADRERRALSGPSTPASSTSRAPSPTSDLVSTPSLSRSPSLLSLISSFLPFASPAHEEPSPRPRAPTSASRLLRRAARSRLVDAYARWVQPTLASRTGKCAGGWGAWQARALLSRARDEMDALMSSASSSSSSSCESEMDMDIPLPPSPTPSASSSSSSSPNLSLPTTLPPTPPLSHSPISSTSTTSSPRTSFPLPLSPSQLASYSRLTSRISELRGALRVMHEREREREREWCEGIGERCERRRMADRRPTSTLRYSWTPAEEDDNTDNTDADSDSDSDSTPMQLDPSLSTPGLAISFPHLASPHPHPTSFSIPTTLPPTPQRSRPSSLPLSTPLSTPLASPPMPTPTPTPTFPIPQPQPQPRPRPPPLALLPPPPKPKLARRPIYIVGSDGTPEEDEEMMDDDVDDDPIGVGGGGGGGGGGRGTVVRRNALEMERERSVAVW